MAKKSDTTAKTTAPAKAAAPVIPTPLVASSVPAKAPAPAKPAGPVKPAVKPAAKKKVVSKATKAPAAKPKKVVKAKAPVAAPAEPIYTRHDIALRAYFISEKRVAHGLPGNEHQDWLEAERQLAAERAKPQRLKKA